MQDKFIKFVNDICKSDSILSESIVSAYKVLSESVEYPDRIEGETNKAYAKRIKNTMSSPTELPEEYNRYFVMDGATIVPMENLVSSKTDAQNVQGGRNAPILMRAAYDGVLERRAPISVQKMDDGRYLILDGNGTYTGASRYGWTALPVMVV